MAASGFDATNGSPLFSDSDAPDIKVDPRTVAIYAADVGNRIVRANLAGLNAYTYARAGLSGYASDTKSDYLHDGSGWKIVSRPWTAYAPSVTNVTGTFSTAKYMISQGMVTVKLRMAVASMSTNPTIGLPVNASDSLKELLMSRVHYIPSAGSEGIGHVLKASTTVVSLVTETTLAGTVYVSNVNATSPITFGATSTIAATFQYEAA